MSFVGGMIDAAGCAVIAAHEAFRTSGRTTSDGNLSIEAPRIYGRAAVLSGFTQCPAGLCDGFPGSKAIVSKSPSGSLFSAPLWTVAAAHRPMLSR